MPMEADRLRIAVDGLLSGFDNGEAVDVLAHGNGDIGETLRTGDQVELADGRAAGWRCRRRAAGCRSRPAGEPWSGRSPGWRC